MEEDTFMSKWEYKEIVYEYGTIKQKTGETDFLGKDKYETMEGWIIRDTVEKVRYEMGSKLINVFNILGEQGFELIDSNQIISGIRDSGGADLIRGNSGVGYSQTDKIFFYFKKKIN